MTAWNETHQDFRFNGCTIFELDSFGNLVTARSHWSMTIFLQIFWQSFIVNCIAWMDRSLMPHLSSVSILRVFNHQSKVFPYVECVNVTLTLRWQHQNIASLNFTLFAPRCRSSPCWATFRIQSSRISRFGICNSTCTFTIVPLLQRNITSTFPIASILAP